MPPERAALLDGAAALGVDLSDTQATHLLDYLALISRWTRGLFQDAESGALLYVNRGLGVAGPPVRLNCSREISLLRLLAQKSHTKRWTVVGNLPQDARSGTFDRRETGPR